MDWFQLIISLAGVLGLIFFMFFMLRKVNKFSSASSGSRLRIIDRANTGRDSSLLVVSVSGKLMLVGVSTGKIEKLCDLELSEEEYFGPAGNTDKPGIKFSDILGNMVGLGGKNKPKAENPEVLYDLQNEQSIKSTENTENSPQGEGDGNTVEPDNQKSNEGERF